MPNGDAEEPHAGAAPTGCPNGDAATPPPAGLKGEVPEAGFPLLASDLPPGEDDAVLVEACAKGEAAFAPLGLPNGDAEELDACAVPTGCPNGDAAPPPPAWLKGEVPKTGCPPDDDDAVPVAACAKGDDAQFAAGWPKGEGAPPFGCPTAGCRLLAKGLPPDEDLDFPCAEGAEG